MFNPKQALQRIRKSKVQKEQLSNSKDYTKQLFPTEHHSNNNDLPERVNNLQAIVNRLTTQLTYSNETVEKLRRQNSQLEIQLLKMEYQNSQLKSATLASDIRQQNSSRINKSHSNNNLIEKSLHQQQLFPQISQKIDTNTIEEQIDRCSPQVQEILEQIKKQPIQNILKKKQQKFRALKATNRQIQNGNKYLQKLANIEKQYQKTMKKPIILIKLDQKDFEF